MDFLDDTGQKVLSSLSKVANVDLQEHVDGYDAEAVSSLPPNSFANIAERKYPVHTKEAVVISAAYAAYSDAPTPVQDKITKMAAFWDCMDEVSEIRANIKDSMPTEKYALDTEINGEKVKAFPYKTSTSLKRAAQYFYNEHNKLPYDARKKTAEHFYKAANQYNVDYDPAIQSYLEYTLGLAVPSIEKASNELMIRRRHLPEEAKEDYQKLAKEIDSLDDLTADSGSILLEKFAYLDETYGIAAKYETTSLCPPEEKIFSYHISKVAGVTDNLVRLTNDMVIDVTDLDWEKINRVDPELYEACKCGNIKVAKEVLPTWPRSDVEVLVDMLKISSAV